eukprot:jgi/Chlat1/7759/Chrsp66S07328
MAAAAAGPGSEAVSAVLRAGNFFARMALPLEHAEPHTVRKAYRTFALQIHPDKCSDPRATEAFKLLSEAFDCLYDENQQLAYLPVALASNSHSSHSKSQRKRHPPKHSQKQPYAKKKKEWWEGRSWADIERELRRREEAERAMRAEYTRAQSGRFNRRKTAGQLKSARGVLEELDRRKGVNDNPLWTQPDDPAEDDSSDAATADKPPPPPSPHAVEQELLAVLQALRDAHAYCFYCGTQYSDREDMLASCPGVLEDEH